MNSFSGDRRLIWAVWALAAVVAASTAAVLLGAGRRLDAVPVMEIPEVDEGPADGMVAASVGGTAIYHEDLAMVGIDDPSVLGEWVEDQLLADLAVEAGLENPRRSRLLQERVRQLYLRDELLSRTYSRVPFPDSLDVMTFMQADSPAYMVERHYWQILVADGQLADSIHQRLSRGENFQLTAENLSLGQKAGIGGDLGFMTAGELMAYGIPRDMALIEGLGRPVESSYGWHILMVDEVRSLEDTARVMWAVADDMHRQMLRTARDSLLELASLERDIYIDPSLIDGGAPETEVSGTTQGRGTQ
ncbi:MAG: peptidylprolyl isomerase [Candidatus Fermentibacteraceae bacterium]|nr:peptidylprolyl isomerase [Candidatus Fermentibacteraceae bacterium]